MSLQAKTMTHQERLLWLAEREIRLPETEYNQRRGEGWRPTSHYFPGKAPRFPTLRQECLGSALGVAPPLADGSTIYMHQKVGCSACQGRGWVPVDDPKATLPCAYEWGFEKHGEEDIVAMCRLAPNSAGTLEHGPTHNEAAIHALYGEVKAQDAEAKRMQAAKAQRAVAEAISKMPVEELERLPIVRQFREALEDLGFKETP